MCLQYFHGAHTYVSASWYSNQHIGSTWNYQAVHAHGILNFKDERLPAQFAYATHRKI